MKSYPLNDSRDIPYKAQLRLSKHDYDLENYGSLIERYSTQAISKA